ncbi:Vacuolar sorting-associated protein [Nymphaea thermarum]|nr:Vacuolar sorting-associated protein [Nymphaea thermarum]
MGGSSSRLTRKRKQQQANPINSIEKSTEHADLLHDMPAIVNYSVDFLAIPMVLLEGAKATTDTVDALRTGAEAIKKIQQEMNIDNVDMIMEEIHDQVDNLRQIQEALSAPLGVADFDDVDELEEELLALEDDDRVEEKLQEQLLRPVTVSISQPVDHARQPVSHSSRLLAVSQETKEKEELDELIAEMAI